MMLHSLFFLFQIESNQYISNANELIRPNKYSNTLHAHIHIEQMPTLKCTCELQATCWILWIRMSDVFTFKNVWGLLSVRIFNGYSFKTGWFIKHFSLRIFRFCLRRSKKNNKRLKRTQESACVHVWIFEYVWVILSSWTIPSLKFLPYLNTILLQELNARFVNGITDQNVLNINRHCSSNNMSLVFLCTANWKRNIVWCSFRLCMLRESEQKKWL